MGYVLLGHGGFEADPAATSPDMEIVAIPPGTRVFFYSDAGQALLYGTKDLDNWERIKEPWPPVDSTGVTYNLTLESALDTWDGELKNDPRFGGHELIRPGIGDLPNPVRMCTGTPASCPTSPEQIKAGMTHTCDGILGRRDFQGNDLHWLACTWIYGGDEAVVDAAMEGVPRLVPLGADPDQFITLQESDRNAIDEVNIEYLENTPSGSTVDCRMGGDVLLIGADHEELYLDYVRVQPDYYKGFIFFHDDRMVSFSDFPDDRAEFLENYVFRFFS
ncbi:putative adhesin [Streptomyces sp. NPDC057910]|uniref:putative adhesin n=1 Tax=Streptomyces sp. NPDC057910 TaxID=3346278 RepID=UPI0036E37915